jgi:hypothetical protein
MPFNLNFPELLPNTPYNISIDMRVGDEVIDTFRSFFTTTPPILNKNIKNFTPVNVIAVSPWTTARAARPYVPERQEVVNTYISQVQATLQGRGADGGVAKDWTGSKTNLGKTADPAPFAPLINVTFQLASNPQGLVVNSVTSDSSVSGVSELFSVLRRYPALDADEQNRIMVTVSAADQELRMKYVRAAKKKNNYWSGSIRSVFFKAKSGSAQDRNYRKTKGFLNYTGQIGGIKTIPAQRALAATGFTQDKLTATANPEIMSEVNAAIQGGGETLKYSIHFLYCDEQSDEMPLDNQFIYLDDSFVPASGEGSDGGSVGFTRASGTRFQSGSTFNLPNEDTDSANFVMSDVMSNKVIFDNSTTQTIDEEGALVAGEFLNTTERPSRVWVAFTVITHTFDSGVWRRDFAYRNQQGQPAISSPFRVGIG